MAMMSRRVVFRGEVATRTDRVALSARLAAVRVVAIAARYAARVHAALEKRAPRVHLVVLLSVWVIQRSREQRRAIVVEEWLARFISVGNLAASRMTLCACLDLAICSARP